MKTISLIYGYSARNAGDFAITLGAIDILRSLGYHIKLFSRYRHNQKDYIEAEESLKKLYGDKIEIFESPFYLDRSSSLFTSIFHYVEGAAIAFGMKKNKRFSAELFDSDIVIFNGGNLFRCHSFIDFTRLCALMYPLKLAMKNGRKYIVLPQSASKINILGRKIMSPILRHAECVFLRERDSYNYIRQLIPSANYLQSIDLAFFIDKNQLSSLQRKKTIAMTLRFHTVGDISYLPDNCQKNIFERMGHYVNTLRNEHELIVVVQTDKDYAKSKEFADIYNLSVFKSNDPIELLNFYKSVSLLIGMRLHSIILALSVGTPCFGLFYSQWGLKNPGLMNYFNMPYKMMDSGGEGNITSDMTAMQNLISNIDIHSKEIKTKIDIEYNRFIDTFDKI